MFLVERKRECVISLFLFNDFLDILDWTSDCEWSRVVLGKLEDCHHVAGDGSVITISPTILFNYGSFTCKYVSIMGHLSFGILSRELEMLSG